MKRFITLALAFAASVLALGAQQTTDSYDHYYTNLPVELEAPTLASFPDNSVVLTDFGGVGNGLELNTEPFRKAISALEKLGGGHLVVPAGIWLTGPISLKDNIDLHLDRGAVIMATHDRTQHLKGSKPTTLISASKRTNVAITGEGTIDGNGHWWRAVKRDKVSDTEWKRFLAMGGTVSDDGKLWYPYDLHHSANIADSPEAQEKLRTHLVRFTDCNQVLVSGVTLQNAPKFHLIPTRCTNVVIDGVTVRCPWNAQNGDGIDLSSCRKVLVVNNTVDVGDDGICMKAGAGESGVKYGPCADILIQDNTVYHAHGGFVIGSEFSGGMRNIVVRDNLFSGTDTGLRFKSGVGRGGKCEGLYISNIVMTDIIGEAIVFECTYQDKAVGAKVKDQAEMLKAAPFAPEFCDIHISDVVCRGCATAIEAAGIPSLRTIYDVEVSDSVFFYHQRATAIDDHSEITTTNCTFTTFEN